MDLIGRAVPEWIGATPDTDIPPRVRERVWLRANGHCTICTRKLYPGDDWQADHTVALINGGQNRESNLRLVCDWCHKGKTAADVAEKARTSRIRKRHLGIRKPSRFPGSKNGKVKIKINREVVDRATGQPVKGRGA